MINLDDIHAEILENDRTEFHDITSDGDYFSDGGLYEIDSEGNYRAIPLIKPAVKTKSYYSQSQKPVLKCADYVPEKFPFNERLFEGYMVTKKGVLKALQIESEARYLNDEQVLSKTYNRNRISGISKVLYIAAMDRYNNKKSDRDFGKLSLAAIIAFMFFVLILNLIK